MRKIRVKRVQWLSLYMALHTDYIEYDLKTRLFRAPEPGPQFALPSVESNEDAMQLDLSTASSNLGS